MRPKRAPKPPAKKTDAAEDRGRRNACGQDACRPRRRAEQRTAERRPNRPSPRPGPRSRPTQSHRTDPYYLPTLREDRAVAEITAALVKELREKSGAGMMDCKKALAATDGDKEKAMDELRKQGLASAQKRSSRATKEGAVDSYIHAGGKIGVLVEVASRPTSSPAARTSRSSRTTSRCTSRRPRRSGSRATRCPRTSSSARRRSTPSRSRASPRTCSRRSSRASSRSASPRRASWSRPSSRTPDGTHRAAAHRPRRRHRRERRGPPLRALPARRDASQS